jgi:hypothetical protein
MPTPTKPTYVVTDNPSPVRPKTIYQKVATIQATIGAIEKDKSNPAFRGAKYFDVNTLAAALIPLLQEQNVLMTMPVYADGEGQQTICLLLRDLDDGTELKAASAYLPVGLTIQQLGGAITYLRRYLPVSYFYLQTEDDDGNQASQVAPRHAGTTASGAPTAATKRTESFQKADLDNIPVVLLDEEDPLGDLTS